VGKFDPRHLRVGDRLVTALPASPLRGLGAHDERDWRAIRAWAETLAAMLPPAAHVRGAAISP
jgi:menaquinone-dependent protoporphyrinogen oxidase